MVANIARRWCKNADAKVSNVMVNGIVVYSVVCKIIIIIFVAILFLSFLGFIEIIYLFQPPVCARLKKKMCNVFQTQIRRNNPGLFKIRYYVNEAWITFSGCLHTIVQGPFQIRFQLDLIMKCRENSTVSEETIVLFMFNAAYYLHWEANHTNMFHKWPSHRQWRWWWRYRQSISTKSSVHFRGWSVACVHFFLQ